MHRVHTDKFLLLKIVLCAFSFIDTSISALFQLLCIYFERGDFSRFPAGTKSCRKRKEAGTSADLFKRKTVLKIRRGERSQRVDL